MQETGSTALARTLPQTRHATHEAPLPRRQFWPVVAGLPSLLLSLPLLPLFPFAIRCDRRTNCRSASRKPHATASSAAPAFPGNCVSGSIAESKKAPSSSSPSWTDLLHTVPLPLCLFCTPPTPAPQWNYPAQTKVPACSCQGCTEVTADYGNSIGLWPLLQDALPEVDVETVRLEVVWLLKTRNPNWEALVQFLPRDILVLEFKIQAHETYGFTTK